MNASRAPHQLRRIFIEPGRVTGTAGTSGSQASFAAFLEAMPDAIVVINREGRIVASNAQTERLFGYSSEGLNDTPVEGLIPERYHQAHATHRTRYARTPQVRPMGEGLELYGRRKDGSEFPVDISLSPVRIGGDTLFVAAIRDTTERKRLEAIRDEFIANAAHELRTPMATLAGLGETLAMHLDRMTPEQISEALSALKRQGERASTLVSNLLDLSQIEGGRMRLRLESVHLQDAVRRALETAPPPEGHRVEVAGQDADVHADPVRLQQTVTNLLTNAYRYGGPHVRIAVAPDGQLVQLLIEDDGPGVAPDLATRLFEPFTRGPQAGEVGGSGIGLALCRRLVEAFGGSIRYEHREGGGARFVATLKRSNG